MTTASRIYLSPPHLGSDERQLLLDALESNWIAPLGPHVDAFEREFAEKLGVGHAVALSSGTAALHLALLVGRRSAGRHGPHVDSHVRRHRERDSLRRRRAGVHRQRARKLEPRPAAPGSRSCDTQRHVDDCRRRCSWSTCAVSAPIGRRSAPLPTIRRVHHRRCCGVARRNLRRSTGRRRWPTSVAFRSTATRSSLPAAAGCSARKIAEWAATAPSSCHAGSRSGAALPALPKSVSTIG